MGSTARSEAISQAINEQDTSLLGAVLNAKHPIALGLSSKAELEGIRERVLSSLAPNAKAKRDAYKKAEKRLGDLTMAWIETEDSLTAKELRDKYKEMAEKAAQASAAAQSDV